MIFFKCNLSYKDFTKHFCNKNVNQFWKDVFICWCQIHFKKPLKFVDIKEQIIWLNSYIRVNNKPVFYTRWYSAGCKCIGDLLGTDGMFLDFTEFKRKFDIDCDFVTYYGIISAIPHEWKHILRQVDDAVLSSLFDY